MKNLADLSRQLIAFADALPEKLNKIAKETVLAMETDLVYSTPVDTSKALSNWQVTLNAPATDDIPAHSEGEFGSTRGVSAAQAINEAQTVLRAKKAGVPVFITNNVDYLEDLNNGSSRQAPAGFYERALLIGRKTIAKHG